jgi:S1/P1 Nuclease
VNQLAIYELPGNLRVFFFHNMEYMVRQAPRPDLRRNQDSTEASKHFIDLEMYGDSAGWKMPMQWEEAVRIHSKDSLLKYGHLPYLIMKVKDSLTLAFKRGLKDSILFYAADLGHYIGDAHVPLHTTVNYDGQLTNQRGLHSLWESMIPEIELDKYQLSSKHRARYLDHPEQEIWKTIRQSYSLLNDVFLQEKEASKNFTDSSKFRIQVRRGREVKSYTPAFAAAYSQRLGFTINQQLIHSADLLADFIYTSWVDAGKPNIDKVQSKKEKKKIKSEVNSFRKNKLIKDSLLLSKKIVSGE